MYIIIALLCHVGPWLWVWSSFSLSFILSSCSGQVFPLCKTLGIWDSQSDMRFPASSKLSGGTGSAASQTRSSQKDVSRGGWDCCSLFLSLLRNDSDHQAVVLPMLWRFNNLRCIFLLVLVTLYNKALDCTAQGCIILTLSFTLEERLVDLNLSSASRLPGVSLTVQSLGMCWYIPLLSVGALTRTFLTAAQKVFPQACWDTGLLPGPPLKLENSCSYQICQKCQGGREKY